MLTPERIAEILSFGEHTTKSTKATLTAVARAIEAEVRKQDDALILQLVEALEKAESVYHVNDTHPIAKRQASAAIVAGRARLGRPHD